VCIYDHAFPARWREWCEAVKTAARTREAAATIDTPRKLSALSTIREVSEADETGSVASTSTAIAALAAALEVSCLAHTAPTGPPLTSLHSVAPGILSHIFSFASDYDLCQLHMSCGVVRDVIGSDLLLQHRRCALLEELTPTGKELSKQRKQEKKKKLKAANSKVSNKKDGHKKVKVCRR
jgi:hypothetical protein